MSKTGLALERVLFLTFLTAAGNLPPQDTKLTPKRGPNQHPGPQKDPKTATFHPETPNRHPKGIPNQHSGAQVDKYPPTEVAGNLILHI